MHLSLLSDASVSREPFAVGGSQSAGRAHRDGLVRGLLFLAAISVPLVLAIVTGQSHLADASAGYAQSFDASR